MTEQELAEMERRDALTQKLDVVRMAQERHALLQEVKRLRGVVEAAFREGQESSKTDRDDMAWYWPQSDTRKALEGA